MNNVDGIKISKAKALLSGVVMVVFSLLAINALIASRKVDGELDQYSKANMYLASQSINDARLAKLIEFESKGLEFMVWDSERRQLSQELSGMLQQRININPFNRQLWVRLSYLQPDSGVDITERAWTIDRALRLNGWDYFSRSHISHHCVVDNDQFRQLSEELCSSLILNLPEKWSERQRAQHVGVSIDVLKNVVQQEKDRRYEREQQ